MDVTILGSGTLVPNDTRRSPSHVVEAENVLLLLDCGSGTVHGLARHGIAWPRLTHLALSHFHTDHVGDIPALFFALKHGSGGKRSEPLTVLGPPGTSAFWKRLTAAHGDHLVDPGFHVEVVELEREGEWTSAGGDLRLRTHPAAHTAESVAWRVETNDGVVGYTGDTGPDRELARFLHAVDLLICECSLPDPPTMDTHLTPQGVADLSREAVPALVITTHCFPGLDPEEVPELVAKAGYSGQVVAGRDGMKLHVDKGKG